MTDVKIFHIDDDPDQIKLMEKFSKDVLKLDYTGFSKANDFKVKYKVRKPDIAIIDLDLKEGENEGFEILKFIRNDIKSDGSIIIMSKRGLVEDINYGLELGADDYITKPADFKILEAKILSLLKKNSELSFKSQPLKNEYKGIMSFNIKLAKLDEYYLYLESDDYILKQSSIILENDIFQRIFKKKKMKFIVHDCVIDENTKKYNWKVMAEKSDDEYFQNISNYILRGG